MQKAANVLREYRSLTHTEDKLTDEPNEVCANVKNEIENILGKNNLSAMLIALTKHGQAGGFSDNVINTFETEREVKILDVDKKALIEKLSGLGATGVFDGIIDDIYLDYSDFALDNADQKTSFRIRFKIHADGSLKVYYTIKKSGKMMKQRNSEVVMKKS